MSASVVLNSLILIIIIQKPTWSCHLPAQHHHCLPIAHRRASMFLSMAFRVCGARPPPPSAPLVQWTPWAVPDQSARRCLPLRGLLPLPVTPSLFCTSGPSRSLHAAGGPIEVPGPRFCFPTCASLTGSVSPRRRGL